MNDEVKLIYLFRHGETNLNVQGITMGQMENLQTEFTEKGYKQIENIKEKIVLNNIEAIYSSDSQRTVQTAQIANNTLPLYITKDLRGLNMGKYQGLPMEEFYKCKDVQLSFMNYDLKIGDGESINDLNNRIIKFINNICDETKYRRIALITHSAVISNIKSFLLGTPYSTTVECVILYNNKKLSVIKYTDLESIKNEKIKKKIKDDTYDIQ